MLEVKSIQNGIVIDHIPAGMGLQIFSRLFPDSGTFPTVLLMNVPSHQRGKKDIIKIENTFDVDIDFLGLLDTGISVNFIRDEKVVEKRTAALPGHVEGLFPCTNPRCITNNDDHCTPRFERISDGDTPRYLCHYCEEITDYQPGMVLKG